MLRSDDIRRGQLVTVMRGALHERPCCSVWDEDDRLNGLPLKVLCVRRPFAIVIAATLPGDGRADLRKISGGDLQRWAGGPPRAWPLDLRTVQVMQIDAHYVRAFWQEAC